MVRTERLVLRPFRPEDVDAVHRACEDPELQRWLPELPWPCTRESAAEFVTAIAPLGREAGTDLPCAVEFAGELVGSCGAHRVHLLADVANAASMAVAQRAGFQQEGVVRACLAYRDGTRGDAALFGRLADG